MRLYVLALSFVFYVCPAYAECAGQTISRNVFNAPVCVPVKPARVVALDPLLTLGMLHELEVSVVGTPVSAIQDAALRAAVKRTSIEDLGHPLQPSLERILALEPELIIGSSDFHAQVYEKLSRIAPTLLLDHIDWKEHLRLLAKVTDRAQKAEDSLEAYERRAASIKARVPDIEVSVARVRPGGFNVYLDGPAAYAPYAVLREAGIKRTAYETTTDNTVVKRPDWEEVVALTGDVMLYVSVGGYDPAGDDALAAETTANPLWQMLPAVRAGRAYRVDRATWMGFHGVASAHRVLDDIERYILNAP